MITVDQCLEGPVNNALIQDLVKQEEITKQQVESALAKLDAFKVELVKPE